MTYDIPDDLRTPEVEAWFGRRGRIWAAAQRTNDPKVRRGHRAALWVLGIDPLAVRLGLLPIAEHAEGDQIKLTEFLDA